MSSVNMCACSTMSDSATPWNLARQAPLSMKVSRQEFWSRLPFPTPGNLPHLGIEPTYPASLESHASAGAFYATWETP